MSKARQKQLEKLKLERQNLNYQYDLALRNLISTQETTQIILNYCLQYFNREVTDSMEQYSPIHISRLIYDRQIQQIKKDMEGMPNKQCRIDHFIVIMLNVLKVPLEKSPMFMVGLKDMFRQIASQGKDLITYQEIFRYMVGELLIMKEDQQNTQFHIQFFEKKKQDFLLHDNGIKKVYYSNDLKISLSLDFRAQSIKIYDEEMRCINRFFPKKQMHQGRLPQVVDFDYSEMTMRLGIIFSDQTIESIHLPNFLNKTTEEFQSTSLNQLIFPLPKNMKKIVYIHMINKWVTFSQQINQLYLLDMEKVRLKPQQVLEHITIDTNEMQISSVLEVVPLSMICLVAGNQIQFFSQNFKLKKAATFIYHDTISHLKYNEEKNVFYLSGYCEKSITIFSINRSKTSFKISSFSINRVISDFQFFPLYDTILLIDQKHELRLIHEISKNVYKQQSYAHIVKNQDQTLKCYKTAKNQFMIYQTYMLGFNLQKVAIEKEIQLNYLEYWHYDHKKEEFYFSVNDQLICFSLLFGDLRRNYNSDSSNLSKHEAFFLGKNTRPFLIDSNQCIYDLYMKNQSNDGENRSYKKKFQTKEIVKYFYDQEMKNIMIIGCDMIIQIRNDSNNSFTNINTINFSDFSKIASCRFCKKSKYLTFITSDYHIFQFQNFETHISKAFKVQFQKQQNGVSSFVIDFDYCSDLDVIMILNSNRQFYIFQRMSPSNLIMIDISDYLPYKLRSLNFYRMKYHIFKEKGRYYPSILFMDEAGFLIDINLQPIYLARFVSKKRQQFNIKSFQKQTHQITISSVNIEKIKLNKSNKVKLSSQDVIFHKAHQKQIQIIAKLKVEIITILTIGKDGFLKLWNEKYEHLFCLKLPNLQKIVWNMDSIHSIKNKKSIEDIRYILKNSFFKQQQERHHAEKALTQTRKLKNLTELPRRIKFQEEIPLEIQNKDLQEIIIKEQSYIKNLSTTRNFRPKQKFTQQKNTIDAHPWRNKRQFITIYQKASPNNRYSKTIPQNLLSLRNSLDMTEKKKKKENYNVVESILPLLKTYEYEKKNQKTPEKKKNHQKQFENFQSCIYVRSQRPRKRLNQLDEVDREFMRKQMQQRGRRVASHRRAESLNMTIDLGQISTPAIENRYDTMKDIWRVFQQHNRQALLEGKGRIIQIPTVVTPKQK